MPKKLKESGGKGKGETGKTNGTEGQPKPTSNLVQTPVNSCPTVSAPHSKAKSAFDADFGPSKKPKPNPPSTMSSSSSSSSSSPSSGSDSRHTPSLSTGSSGSMCMKRIRKDLQELYSNPPGGIFVLPQENDLTQMNALIVGPADTPYDGGFFQFHLKFDQGYPMKPPRVRFMTTDNGKVRFNPNFYNCGKVCLSILGTWQGPQWTASQTLCSLLCSIQSLMTEEPHRNEPSYENIPATNSRVKGYSDVILHETLRVSVCDTLDAVTTCPKALLEQVAKPEFVKRFDDYVSRATKRLSLDGKPFEDFLGGCSGNYAFAAILRRLNQIRDRLLGDGGSDFRGSELVFGAFGETTSNQVHRSFANQAGVALLDSKGQPINDRQDDYFDLNLESDEELDSYEELSSDDDDNENDADATAVSVTHPPDFAALLTTADDAAPTTPSNDAGSEVDAA